MPDFQFIGKLGNLSQFITHNPILIRSSSKVYSFPFPSLMFCRPLSSDAKYSSLLIKVSSSVTGTFLKLPFLLDFNKISAPSAAKPSYLP